MLIYYLYFSFSKSLSEFCKEQSSDSSDNISFFDIPFQLCGRFSFHGVTLKTSQSAIENYFRLFRSLRLDNGIHLIIDNVTTGSFLLNIDIFEATLELNLAYGVREIEGSIRINHKDGGRLLVNGGSFRLRRERFLRIIHTNDIHCGFNYDTQSGVIGLARFAQYINNERKNSDGYSVLVVDAGDFVQGKTLCTLTNGEAAVEAMKLLHFDAFTIGNHFWDFGHQHAFQNLQSLIESKLPVLVANLIDNSTTNPLVFQNYTIKELDGLKIGIFGLTTPDTKYTTKPESVADVAIDSDIVGISQRMVKILREDEKCDIVILICHIGYTLSEVSSNRLAECFDGIDVIVDGHSHTVLEDGVFGLFNDYQTLIVQTGNGLRKVGNADILIDWESKKVIGKRATLLSFEDFADIEEDSSMSSFLNSSEAEFKELTNTVIGKSNVNLTHDTSLRLSGDSKIGIFVAAACKWVSNNADFAFVNGGGVRTSIYSGNVTFGDVLSVSPFDNIIQVVSVSGSKLKEILSYGTANYKIESFGGFPIISGLSFSINLSKSSNEDGRIFNLIQLDSDGKEMGNVEDNKNYSLAISDFLQSGGDGYSMLSDLELIGIFGTVLEGLINFIKSLPESTITGNEAFFQSYKITETGNLPLLRSFPKLTRANSNVESVLISGNLNALNYNFGSWKNFYQFTVHANNVIASDVDVLKMFSNSNFSYAEVNGIYFGGWNFSYDKLNAPSQSCNGFFKKKNSNEECQTYAPFVVFFVIFLASIALFVILIFFYACKLKKSSNLVPPLSTSEHKMQATLN